MAKRKIIKDFPEAIQAGAKVLWKWYDVETWETTKDMYSEVFDWLLASYEMAVIGKKDPVQAGAKALCKWHGIEQWNTAESRPLYIRVFKEAIQAYQRVNNRGKANA
jgi:predicted enzyme related to lactoylglutathione lyase